MARTRLPASISPEAPRSLTVPRTARAAVKMPLQSEKDFQAAVMLFARIKGWRAYHTHDSRHSAPGFPDAVFVRRPRVLFVEFKREDGVVSDDQQAWLDDLRACGQSVFIWRPSQWAEIEKVLT